jgi:toxin ParE1/3/4
MSLVWRVRLAEQAELDVLGITLWTVENFGAQQAQAYAQTLSLALEALHDGPEVLGVTVRDDLGLGVLTLHVARHGRKGRHFVVFRAATEPEQTIEVLRLLHDSMDLARHLPSANDPNHG